MIQLYQAKANETRNEWDKKSSNKYLYPFSTTKPKSTAVVE
jgi:hypothetical protein